MDNDGKILALLEQMQKDNNARFDKLEAGQAKLEAGQAKLEAGQAKLEAGQAKLEAGQAKLEAGQAKLEAGQSKLEAGQSKLNASQAKLNKDITLVRRGLAVIEYEHGKKLDIIIDDLRSHEEELSDIRLRLLRVEQAQQF